MGLKYTKPRQMTLFDEDDNDIVKKLE